MCVSDAVDTLILVGESDPAVSDFALGIILELVRSLGANTLPPSAIGFEIPGGIFGIAGAMLGVKLRGLDVFTMSGFDGGSIISPPDNGCRTNRERPGGIKGVPDRRGESFPS